VSASAGAGGSGDVAWASASALRRLQRPVTAAAARLQRPTAALRGCSGRRRLQRPYGGCGSVGCRPAAVAPRLGLAEAKKNQTLITMLEERNSCRIECLY
jgi:hypothetical protein